MDWGECAIRWDNRGSEEMRNTQDAGLRSKHRLCVCVDTYLYQSRLSSSIEPHRVHIREHITAVCQGGMATVIDRPNFPGTSLTDIHMPTLSRAMCLARSLIGSFEAP